MGFLERISRVYVSNVLESVSLFFMRLLVKVSSIFIFLGVAELLSLCWLVEGLIVEVDFMGDTESLFFLLMVFLRCMVILTIMYCCRLIDKSNNVNIFCDIN
jgi:hypothetical protein